MIDVIGYNWFRKYFCPEKSSVPEHHSSVGQGDGHKPDRKAQTFDTWWKLEYIVVNLLLSSLLLVTFDATIEG